jgi:CHASE3 domain sensor protein
MVSVSSLVLDSLTVLFLSLMTKLSVSFQKIRELEHTNQQLESQNTELTKMVQDLEEKEREWSSAK